MSKAAMISFHIRSSHHGFTSCHLTTIVKGVERAEIKEKNLKISSLIFIFALFVAVTPECAVYETASASYVPTFGYQSVGIYA